MEKAAEWDGEENCFTVKTITDPSTKPLLQQKQPQQINLPPHNLAR